ncbi:MAG: Rab family GTPase [Bacteroidota bacterium]
MQSAKVVLTGNFGVGKTSLFRRFIEDTFSEAYLTTIGVKVDRKQLTIEDHAINLLLWDLAGEHSQSSIPRSYFLGASAVVLVLDPTRPDSYRLLEEDLAYLRQLLPECRLWLVMNKIDLLSEADLAKAESRLPAKVQFKTSARTGENVEALFEEIATALIATV